LQYLGASGISFSSGGGPGFICPPSRTGACASVSALPSPLAASSSAGAASGCAASGCGGAPANKEGDGVVVACRGGTVPVTGNGFCNWFCC